MELHEESIHEKRRSYGCDSALLQRGFKPDKYTFTFVLKLCTESFYSEIGISIHDEVARRSMQGDTVLLNMYNRLGMAEIPSQMFDSMRKLDVVSWNAMIGGFCQNNRPHQALGLFIEMHYAVIVPNRVTVLNLFPAIYPLSNSFLCRSLHGFITRRWLLPTIANGLIDAYSKCGFVEASHQIFGEMLDDKDDVFWGTMMMFPYSAIKFGGIIVDSIHVTMFPHYLLQSPGLYMSNGIKGLSLSP